MCEIAKETNAWTRQEELLTLVKLFMEVAAWGRKEHAEGREPTALREEFETQLSDIEDLTPIRLLRLGIVLDAAEQAVEVERFKMEKARRWAEVEREIVAEAMEAKETVTA